MRDLSDTHQIEQLRSALCFVEDFSVAIDVGAHRGIWTREMVKHFNRVIAIEPSNAHHKITDSAIVINAACGARKGRCSIKDGTRNTGQKHVVEGDDVDVITLDGLNIIPSFIKIDVEGMEFDVLKGAKKTIITHKPFVFIEESNLCERYGHSLMRASKLLKRWGMKRLVTFHMEPEKDVNILWGWE